jgi:hypothetical protein
MKRYGLRDDQFARIESLLPGLDRGFEFGGCFARLFHAYLAAVRRQWSDP